MGRVRIRNKEFAVPNIARLVHYSIYETLLFLGQPKKESGKTICFGIGTVTKIQKGEEFDMVYMNFGRDYSREICVKHNHARRQIYTLKRGQLAWFYGVMQVYKDKGEFKTIFYAMGFQGWFVPKNMDIIKINPEDIEKMTEENESKIDFIDKLLGDEL